MSQYIKDDNIIRVSESSTLSVTDRLPVGTYVLDFDKRAEQFFLKRIDDFHPGSKVYGDYDATVERIIQTFMDRKGKNLGVLLSGIKGSGKTLTGKMISVRLAREFGFATITINKGFNTSELAAFLHSVDVPCMILFDEFDKVYSYRDDQAASQSGLLDILDGVFESRKLFVMSCNDTSHINPYVFSRPGRIFYHFRYGMLSRKIVNQYCDDNLVYPELKEEILQLCTFVRGMTFDILKAIVEEANRYKESPKKFIEFLNVNYGLAGTYDIQVSIPGGKPLALIKKQYFDFGDRGFGISLPVSDATMALTKLPDSFFRYDEDDEEVYGFYRPEYSDLRAVNPDGSVELVILGGALNAFLRRSTFSELNYQQLTSKL